MPPFNQGIRRKGVILGKLPSSVLTHIPRPLPIPLRSLPALLLNFSFPLESLPNACAVAHQGDAAFVFGRHLEATGSLGFREQEGADLSSQGT